jgi:hypothetical protein
LRLFGSEVPELLEFSCVWPLLHLPCLSRSSSNPNARVTTPAGNSNDEIIKELELMRARIQQLEAHLKPSLASHSHQLHHHPISPKRRV